MRHLAIPFTAAAATAALALAGCASDTPLLDANLGKATAELITGQTLDPAAPQRQDASPLSQGDGVRLKNALDANRKDVGKGAVDVARPIAFEAGR
jgi:hypothetical protein